MILQKNELMDKIKLLVGDRTDDDALNALKDISDTVDSYSNSDADDWKKKYEDKEKELKINDEEWRKKYRDTFFGKTTEQIEKEIEKKDEKDDEKDRASTITLDDLFN